MPRAIFFASLRCVGDVGVAFERRHRDVAKDLFATAAREQMFSESQPVIVAGDKTDKHDRLGAVVEQSMKRFQRAFSVVGEQMVPEFEIDTTHGCGRLTRRPTPCQCDRRRAPPNQACRAH